MLRNLIFNTDFQNFIIPGNFQKFSGTLDITLEVSSYDKILKFLIENQVQLLKMSEKMPCMSKSVKTSQFRSNIQTSRKLLEVSRNDGILKFSIENQVS